MRDRELYAQILGVVFPWRVHDVQLDVAGEQVTVFVQAEASAAWKCPECGREAPRYDQRSRRWRHLDTCQFQTYLVADVPRVQCPEHGVRQVAVPWAEPNSGFTALFEALVIDWLREASMSAVSRQLGVTWDEVDRIMGRAVERGLARRQAQPVRRLGVDETSFQKRHEYVTVVSDLEGGRVLEIADGRSRAALEECYGRLPPEQPQVVEAVAMDMSEPYIQATRAWLKAAESRIAFDRFHVAKLLNDRVNDVRKREHRELQARGDRRLAGSRFLWLQSPEALKGERRTRFASLKQSTLAVARAWALKEAARHLWAYRTRGGATRGWKQWLGWAQRCRLEPMVDVSRTIRRYLWGIVNAVVSRTTSAVSESLNAKIQRIKRLACGFRNRERFRRAIFFHCGGLNLYPASLATHTKV